MSGTKFAFACLFALLSAALAGCSSRAAPGEPASASIEGSYQLPGGGFVGVNRFVNDQGEPVLLYADYGTRVVRQLFATDTPEAFEVGPGFATRTPVELQVNVNRGADDHVRSLLIKAGGGEPAEAVRVPLRLTNVRIPSADAVLAGTLIEPPGRGPHPAIVLLHGSGPLTRHSFGPYPYFFSSLGFAVLVYDKRGTGDSTGELFDASRKVLPGLPREHYPQRLASDVHAALRFLRERPAIDADQIGLWGSSEGGMLTTYVAASDPRVAFAISSSGFVGPLWETSIYQAGNSLRSQGFIEEQIQQVKAATRQWLHTARTGEGFDAMMEFRRLALADRKGWLVGWTPLDVETLEGLRWHWDHVITFDPRPALARVKAPVLGLFGQLDPLTDAANASHNLQAALQQAGNSDVTVKVIPDAGHALMAEPQGGHMAPGVFEILAPWLRARVRFPQ